MTTKLWLKKLADKCELCRPLALHWRRTPDFWLFFGLALGTNKILLENINGLLLKVFGSIIYTDASFFYNEKLNSMMMMAEASIVAITIPIFISVYSYLSKEHSLTKKYIEKHYNQSKILLIIFINLLLILSSNTLFVALVVLWTSLLLFNKTYHYYLLIFDRELVLKNIIKELFYNSEKSNGMFKDVCAILSQKVQNLFKESEALSITFGNAIFFQSSENVVGCNHKAVDEFLNIIREQTSSLIDSSDNHGDLFKVRTSPYRKSIVLEIAFDKSMDKEEFERLDKKIRGTYDFDKLFKFGNDASPEDLFQELKFYILKYLFSNEIERLKEVILFITSLLKSEEFLDKNFVNSLADINFDIFNRYTDYPKNEYGKQLLFDYWLDCLYASHRLKNKELVRYNFHFFCGAYKNQLFPEHSFRNMDRTITSFHRHGLEHDLIFEHVSSLVQSSLNSYRNKDHDFSLRLLKYISFLRDDLGPEDRGFYYEEDRSLAKVPDEEIILCEEALIVFFIYMSKEEGSSEKGAEFIRLIQPRHVLLAASNLAYNNSDRWERGRFQNSKFNRHGVGGTYVSSMYQDLLNFLDSYFREVNTESEFRVPGIDDRNRNFFNELIEVESAPDTMKTEIRLSVDQYDENKTLSIQEADIDGSLFENFSNEFNKRYEDCDKIWNFLSVRERTDETFLEEELYGLVSFINKDSFIEGSPFSNSSVAHMIAESFVEKENISIMEKILGNIHSDACSARQAFVNLSNSKFLNSHELIFFGSIHAFRYKYFDTEGLCKYSSDIRFKKFTKDNKDMLLEIKSAEYLVNHINYRSNNQNYFLFLPQKEKLEVVLKKYPEKNISLENQASNYTYFGLENYKKDEDVERMMNLYNKKDKKFFQERSRLHVYKGLCIDKESYKEIDLIRWEHIDETF